MKQSTLLLTKRICILLLAGFTVFSAESAVGDELDASRQRLNKIERQIEETLKGLRSKQSESGALTQELERLDTEIRRIDRLAKKSDRQLLELSDRLAKQQRALKQLEEAQTLTEKQVRRRLVVLYKTGEVGLIKALLAESESPRDIAEKYVFLSRMVRHDRELLGVYRQQTLDHQAAVRELEELRQKQAAAVERRRAEQSTLQRAHKSKKVLLARVTQSAELLDGTLQELRAKAARLNELVKKLETEQTQSYTESPGGLAPRKGQLAWPVPGKLRMGFGTSRHGDLGTLIESHGFDIEADVGTPVHAAAAGKVIFANNLRGYGNLMIIDHGSKLYTLYAHMARFTKRVGESAAAEEIIAYSGYDDRDAIYFEIRQGGRPLDPADWLKPR